jgi:glycosyltransferase involved in cell wall biosynthesis
VDLVEHGVSGFLAKPGDVESLAEGLNYCLEHRATLGANGREQARAWPWLAAVEKVAGVYRAVGQDEPPTVGIVIPVFNKPENEVRRAIESAINQTFKVASIVIVDDGSRSRSDYGRIVQEYSDASLLHIRYRRYDNSGVAIARNRGIELSECKYVCCIDSDDWIAPDFIRTCVKALEADRSLGIAYTGLYYHKPDGEEGLSTWPGIWDFDAQLERQNQVPTCCVFRREMWQRLGGYRQRYAPKGAGSEDAEFFTRAGAYGWKAALVEPHASALPIYHEMRGKLQRSPTDEEMGKYGQSKTWPACKESFFHYSWLSGQVTGDPEYREMDWLALKPWVDDEQHPFASYATPQKFSHPVRQYDQPLVSVIIPVGPGHEEKVIDALDSLEGQTFRNWECIVVWDIDDTPPDNLMRAYPYVKWRGTGKGGNGPGWARNFGVTFARAPFLLFLDADDTFWIYAPDAIEKMLSAWQAYQAIIYADYMGIAYIDNPEAVVGGKIHSHDPDTKLTLVKYQAYDFDCERALRQPETPEPYIWCNITALIPKVWHEEIGGFDETMDSWEDVDYHWRMVRAGHCYHRIIEPLFLYRFYTGTRRDEGCKIHQNLVQYLTEKYEKDGDPEMCKGCGGRRKTTNPKSTTQRAFASSRQMPTSQAVQAPAGIGIRDEDLIEVIFDDGNIGQHAIIGANATNPMTGRRFQYGDGKSGDKILVHRDDVYITDRNTRRPRIIDQRFRPIEPKQAAPPPEPKQELPPPVALVEEVVAPPEESYSAVTHTIDDGVLVKIRTDDGIDNGEVAAAARVLEQHRAEKAAFSFQVLPGITPDIEAQLRALNLEGPEDILTFGIEGLKTIKGIGPKRADGIIAAIEARQ